MMVRTVVRAEDFYNTFVMVVFPRTAFVLRFAD